MKLISKKIIQTGFSVAALLVVLAIPAQVHAADPVQCKGLDNANCSIQESCSWVNGYERKDGRTVNAFCRTKVKQKASSAATSQPSEKAS